MATKRLGTPNCYSGAPIGITEEDRRQWREQGSWPAAMNFQDSGQAARPEPLDRRRPDPTHSSTGCAAAMMVAAA